MRTPSFSEFKTLVEYLQEELSDAQLQEVSTSESRLTLGFYRFTRQPRMTYLVFDLDKVYPYLVFLSEPPPPAPKKTKPVGLFLTAHAKNHRLVSIQMVEKFGRVMRLDIGQGENLCCLEFRLIPKQPNLIVKVSGKLISWYPVQELVLHNSEYETNKKDEEVRSISFLTAQWLRHRGGTGAVDPSRISESPYEKWKKNKLKDIEKKKKALQSIELQIQQYETEPWSEVGEFIKSYGLKQLKPEWTPFIDFELNKSENIQNCFARAKAAQVKIVGARARQQILMSELNVLMDLSVEKFEAQIAKQAGAKSPAPERAVTGRLRKLLIEGASLTAYMGKSAADNMELLRKSKPHDIWLHLKDYPSAHAVVHRQKAQSVSDQELRQVAQWLVKQGLPEKLTQMGGKFAVVWVECRHVKAIKGDKLGRVTYHNAREISVSL